MPLFAGDVDDGHVAPERAKVCAKFARRLGTTPLLWILMVGANDREVDEILDHGGEGVRSLFLFGLALAFLGVARINPFANVFKPAPRLVAGLFERESAVDTKAAAGRMWATGKAGDEDERLATGFGNPNAETRDDTVHLLVGLALRCGLERFQCAIVKSFFRSPFFRSLRLFVGHRGV